MTQEREKILTAEALLPIQKMVEQTAGLYFEENRHYFIEKRVLVRMKATNSKSARDYFRLLRLGHHSEEMKELISILTTNETYFFRNLPQLESFYEEILPMIVAEKRKTGDLTLRIWSAGCSTGEEPYTIAILLREHLPDFPKWKIEIRASDIDYVVLEKASRGIFGSRQVKDVPPELLDKYFTPNGRDFELTETVKKDVVFETINLMERRELRRLTGMDFVFCRNVLIYFQNESRKQVINSIFDILNPGGFIFLGHAESVAKLSAMFKLVKFEKSITYQK